MLGFWLPSWTTSSLVTTNQKLFVNLPSFPRNIGATEGWFWGGGDHVKEKERGANEAKEFCNGAHNKECDYLSHFKEPKTYANVLKNDKFSQGKNSSSVPLPQPGNVWKDNRLHSYSSSAQFSIEDEDQWKRFSKMYIGVEENPGTTYNIQETFNVKGYFAVKVTPQGVKLCLLEDRTTTKNTFNLR